MNAALKMQFSAGGVIFRREGGGVEMALIATKGGSVWSLPKGVIDKGEKPEEAAIREIAEETGLKGRLVGKIGETTYWYYLREEGARVKKTVYYYLLEYTGGDTSEHDFEVDESAWFPLDEALKRAGYKGDKDIISKAREMIDSVAHGKTGAR